MIKALHSGFAAAALLALAAAADAHPVTYRLTTVTDGQIGSVSFHSAVVTIEFKGDTRSVQTTTAGGVTVHQNAKGSANVTVVSGGTTIMTKFLPGEIFARYDVSNGVVGFGSSVGPYYPFSIDCGNVSCSGSGDWGPGWIGTTSVDGIAAALADPNTDSPDYPSDATLNLPNDLIQPTILTGYVSACASYVLNNFYWSCPAPPTVPLKTQLGTFYVQDSSGEMQVGVFRVLSGSGD